MLNKLKFNNLVISNKNGIQQSRVQTINKLVHKIRNLKALLEKHPNNTKCKERIRKSTETLDLLKKFKRADIMKKVLLLDKPPAAIITNGLSTPEEVGVAILSMNKIMQGLIKRFKMELNINVAGNNEWKQILMAKSKRRQKIERTEEKRRKRIELKQQKVMGRKRQEWLEQNCEEAGSNNRLLDTDINVSTVGTWNIEKLEVADRYEKIMKENKKDTTATKNQSKNNESKQKIIENLINSSKGSENDVENVEVGKNEKYKNTKFNKNSHIRYEEEKSEEALVVDPFFITDNGENYLSSAVVKDHHNANDEINNEKESLHIIKLNKMSGTRNYRQLSKDKNQQDFKNKRRDGVGRDSYNKWDKQNHKNPNFSKSKLSDRKDNINKGLKNQKLQNIKANEENLHPSWVAKQKQKAITTFQGKKTTFEYDDNIKHAQVTQNEANPTQFEKDSLHPSWAAKQKLKPIITAFQGKKITFDNND